MDLMHALTTLCLRVLTNPEDWVILFSEAYVRKVFIQVNTHKATGLFPEHAQISLQAYSL